ncbi:hypothetical protein A9Q87_06730 [Flavobacteriales bacterium 34_180_T64]|nr:hypothetical protein A9Q87_06730 [Flavobacteriales bacterium 34_180_T64]
MVCKNCQTELLSKSDYCNTCGGKVIRNRLTIRNLFEHISETFFNYDNKLLRTFINLLTKPEDVIGSYIAGVRKKYVNVISYFALAISITGLEYFILNKFYPEAIDISALSAKGLESFTNDIMMTIQEYQSFVLMAFIPIYAIIAKIVFFNLKKFNFTEHLVIFMFITAQLSIVGAFIVIPFAMFGIKMGSISLFILGFQLLYSAYCLKRLYQLSFKGIVLRTLWFIVVFFVLYIIAIIAVLAILFFTQGPEFFKELIETQRATSEAVK